ncbi:hypothetical protein [Nisaea sp.]|uniref:hypothetical protein n=1 Tax=Nisaea sp. TaxID=2024842 RepID=UPI003267942D
MNHYSETTQHQLTLGRVMMEAYAKTAYPNARYSLSDMVAALLHYNHVSEGLDETSIKKRYSGTLASLVRECSAGEQQ